MAGWPLNSAPVFSSEPRKSTSSPIPTGVNHAREPAARDFFNSLLVVVVSSAIAVPIAVPIPFPLPLPFPLLLPLPLPFPFPPLPLPLPLPLPPAGPALADDAELAPDEAVAPLPAPLDAADAPPTDDPPPADAPAAAAPVDAEPPFELFEPLAPEAPPPDDVPAAEAPPAAEPPFELFEPEAPPPAADTATAGRSRTAASAGCAE